MPTKAVIFDYIGTLVNCQGYSMDASKDTLYNAIVAEGFKCSKDQFLEEYSKAHLKYRKVRYEEYREVTNAVWVAEALEQLGFKVAADDYRVQAALAVFFKDFIDTLEVRDGAKKLIKTAAERYRVGLLSNFTYAPVIYRSLQKLRINELFQTVVVSEEYGWRKPSGHIFEAILSKLQVHANEAVYIGDSPLEDIKGARQAGMKTIFVPSQFNSLKDLLDSKEKPTFIAKDLQTIINNLQQILAS